eukprot:s2376_g4.t1
MAPIGPAKAEGPGSPAFCRRTSSRGSTRCESPPPRAFTPLSDTAPLILGRTSPEPPRCHSASGDYCASSRPPWRRRVQHRKNPAEEHQREISTKIAELAKRKEPQYPDGLDSDGLSCLFRGYTASVLKTQRTAHPMRKAAWSFVYRARASPQPDVPSSDNVAPVFHRHKEEKRGTCRRLEPSKPRSPPIAGLPPRRMQSSTQPPREDSFEPAPAESFCFMPLPVIEDFDMPPSPDSKETQLKTATLTRQASRESTGSRVEEGDADISDRAPQPTRVKTASQGQGSKNASSAPEDLEAFEEPGPGTPPSSKVAFRRQGSKSELQIEQQEKGLEVFYRLAESNKELHHSELPRALRMMGYMQPNDAWITDLLRAITSFNTVQVNEFLSLVHGYAQRHHDQRAATFAKYEDGHGHMSREGLQKASRDFGIELLPYVVEEVVAEVSQICGTSEAIACPAAKRSCSRRKHFRRFPHAVVHAMPATLPGQMVVTDASQDVADFHVALPKRPAPVITSLSEVDVKLDKLAEKLDVCIKELSTLRLAQRPREMDSGHLKAPETSNAQLTPRSQVSSVRMVADDVRLPISANVPRFNSTDESEVESFTQSFSMAPITSVEGVKRAAASRTRPRRVAANLETAWQAHAKSISGGGAGDMEPIMRLVYRSRAEHVWEFLDDPQSSIWAWWTWSLLRVLVLLSVCTPYLQERQPVLTLVLDICFDTVFMVEFLSRLVSTPSKRTYLKDPLNWADIVSALGLPLRAVTGFAVLAYPPSTALEIVLVFFLPLVRLLKLLRYFESFRLLLDACKNSMEAVPFLAYMAAVITLSSATVIYLVEPRSRIPSMPHSVWLALVTMTTVGYGDFFPVTFWGYITVSVLTCASVLFLALPVGIIGNEFWNVWESRNEVLLVTRVRRALHKWGYAAKDVKVLFQYVDQDGNGTLDLAEFLELVRQMRIGISAENAFKIFTIFDDDNSGTIDCAEFLRHIFPEEYVEKQQAQSQSLRKSQAHVSLALHQLETMHTEKS